MASSSVEKTVHGVLIVDDNPTYRLGLRRLLERTPGVAWVADCDGSGDVPGEVARLSPAVVVLDRHLGQVDGLALVSRIRARSPGVRILVLGGDDAPGLAAEVQAAGADGYLAKDVPDRVLLAWVRGEG